MKTCRICNQTKPADAYRGTRSACRECESARRREWYAARCATSPAVQGGEWKLDSIAQMEKQT